MDQVGVQVVRVVRQPLFDASGHEPLRTLAKYRRAGTKVFFGQNIIHRGEGNVRVGEEVEVVVRER